jgi:hypothetical protein
MQFLLLPYVTGSLLYIVYCQIYDRSEWTTVITEDELILEKNKYISRTH